MYTDASTTTFKLISSEGLLWNLEPSGPSQPFLQAFGKFTGWNRFTHRIPTWLCVIKRHLNASQTATALRPFYFAVHPDLFGRYPKERSVNEESLKVLHEYVTVAQASPYRLKPVEVVFYIRQEKEDLQSVTIKLKSRDIKKTVGTILQSCGLSLDYLNTLPTKKKKPTFSRPIAWHPSYYATKSGEFMFDTDYKPVPQRSLSRWLEENEERIQRYKEASRQFQLKVDKLCSEIVPILGVSSIRWDSVWGIRYYIGCLRTFKKLCEEKTEAMAQTMQGRSLVFGNNTGVNMHGDIVLGSDDVATDWLHLLMSVKANDPVIERLPKMEHELSLLLNSIQIKRLRKEEFVLAQNYEVVLNKLLNSLRRCRVQVKRDLGDLSSLVMVPERESGPLALTINGQFLIPCSLPGSSIVKFIKENKDQAATFLIDAKVHMFYLDQLLEECREKLNISSLSWDDTVTTKQMTECCQRLLDNSYAINHLLHGAKLKVSTYYTLMKDGEITIPWNWVDNT